MRKTLTVAVVCGTCLSAAIALADDGKAAAQAKAERAKLLNVIAELKATLAKQQDLAARERQRAEIEAKKVHAAAAQFKRAQVQVRLQKLSKKGVIRQERRVLILQVPKGGKPLFVKKHAGDERLDHLRAAMKHLSAAGQKELAHAVAKQAERLQAELHKAHQVKGGGKGRPQKGGKADGNIRELSQAIMQLRKQMLVLQKTVEQLQKRRK